jgi:hypothetical protein
MEADERRQKYLEKEEQLRLQRKQEERERWWQGAELLRPRSASSEKEKQKSLTNSSKDKEKLLARYQADYSKWESWIPDDKVSLEEKEREEKAKEDAKNKEFETNNPDFCNQFVQDMNQRKKVNEKKQENAEVIRLKGNKFFKNKDFNNALSSYMEALKMTPFDGKLLLNIAQVR